MFWKNLGRHDTMIVRLTLFLDANVLIPIYKVIIT